MGRGEAGDGEEARPPYPSAPRPAKLAAVVADGLSHRRFSAFEVGRAAGL